MLEIVLILIFAAIIFFVEILWLKILLFFILLGLVLPGMYAMVKGAPFIMTSKKKLPIILDMGNFGHDDYVCDLGCGDGWLIRSIAKRGVRRAVGYEFSIPSYLWAKLQGIFDKSRAEIKFVNFWKQDFFTVDVLFCFLLEESMKDFEKIIWPKLKKGARVISNEFEMQGVKPHMQRQGMYLYIKK